MAGRRQSVFPEDKNFTPHCCCFCGLCGCLEHCLLNCPCCGCFCGTVFYIPFMSILYLIWILQIPITILINLFAFLFCCNFCKCRFCRGSLFIADDDSVPDAHDGVMLYTAQSIKNLHLTQYTSNDDDNNNDDNNKPHDSDDEYLKPDNSNNNSDKQRISILNWNVFGQLGRYWKRYPLLTTRISDLYPDIVCLQEAVTVKWWRFGTVNTIRKIDPSYRGFHVSAYNVLHDYNKLFFQYSCIWRIINEFQSCCNLYCLLPFWKDNFWKWTRRSGTCTTALFNTYVGMIAQIGNAIVYKNNYQLFRSYIPLSPGNKRIALRSLFIIKDNDTDSDSDSNAKDDDGNGKVDQKLINTSNTNSYGRRLSLTVTKNNKKKKRKKLWVVCTHLSPTKDDQNVNMDDDIDDKDDVGDDNDDNGDKDDDDIKSNVDAYSDAAGLNQIKQIIKWMDDAQKKICKADAIVICGDFNATPTSDVYKIMIKHGYKSVVASAKGKEEWTFPTDTWKYPRNQSVKDIGVDDDNINADSNNDRITKDYIWVKGLYDVIVDKVTLVGNQPIDSKHKGEDIQICPSDHKGIYCELLI